MGEVISLQQRRDRKNAPKPVVEEKSNFQKQHEKVVESIKRIDNLLKDLKTNPNNK